MDWQPRERLLELVFRLASIEAAQFWRPLTVWLFRKRRPEHEEFIERVLHFAEEITGRPMSILDSSASAGERLLQIMQKLEDPSMEKRQLAVLYYAMAVGLPYLTEGEEGGATAVPASPLLPPGARAAQERLPTWDVESGT